MFLRYCIYLCFFTLIALFSLPLASKHYLTQWLLENGADTATIEKIRINPFTGGFSLHGVDVRQNGKVVLSDTTLELDLGLWSMLGKQALIHQATLHDIVIDIERFADGSMRLGSYRLDNSATGKSTDLPAEKDQTLWIFRALAVDIENITIHYTQPDLVSTLTIQQARIEKFNTDPRDNAGSLTLTGLLNDAPISLDLESLRILPVLELDGTIDCSAVQLDTLSEMLTGSLQRFSGAAGIAGSIHIRTGDEDRLEVDYNGTISLDHADIAGKDWATQGNLQWQGQASYQSGAEDDGMQVKAEGTLQLANPAFQSGTEHNRLVVADTNVSWDGTLNYAGKKNTINLQGTLRSTALGLSLADSAVLNQEQLTLSGTTKIHTAPDLAVLYTGDISLATTSLNIQTHTFNGDALNWHGTTSYTLDSSNVQTITLNGSLKAKLLESHLNTSDMHISQEAFSATSDFSLTLDAPSAFVGQAEILLGKLVIQQSDNDLLQINTIALEDIRDDGHGGLNVGVFRLSDIQVPPTDAQPITLDIEEITAHHIAYDFSNITIATTLISGATAIKKTNNTQLAHAATILVESSQLAPTAQVHIEQVTADQIVFLQPIASKNQPPQATLQSAQARSISWSTDSGLVLDTVELGSLLAGYSRKDQAKGEPETAQEQDFPAGDQTSAPFPFKIRKIVLTGQSSLTFSDETLTQPFTTTLAITNLDISDIDSTLPDQPLNYELKGAFDTYAPVVMNGSATPFSTTFQLENQTHLRNYSLPRLSPYVVEAIGTYFDSGYLTLVSKLVISGDSLDNENEFVLKDVTSQTVNKELAEKLNNQLPVSLDTALSMLSDSAGNISLSVPIRGQLSDLNIGISDILVTAVGKAIVTGLTPYLAYTVLGPTGALVYVGLQLGQSLLESDLPPLKYEPNCIELTEGHKGTLAEIAKTLKQDADRDYSICAQVGLYELTDETEISSLEPHVVINDQEMRQQLFILGEKRAGNVKTYLVDTFGLNPDHLLICNLGLNMAKDGKGAIFIKK